MTPRRTTLTKAEWALLRKLQRGVWHVDELEWLERHLAPDVPSVLVGEIRYRLHVLREAELAHTGAALVIIFVTYLAG
jgi:hypothetical protein